MRIAMTVSTRQYYERKLANTSGVISGPGLVYFPTFPIEKHDSRACMERSIGGGQ